MVLDMTAEQFALAKSAVAHLEAAGDSFRQIMTEFQKRFPTGLPDGLQYQAKALDLWERRMRDEALEITHTFKTT